MEGVGRFLELSSPVGDIKESLDFYRMLGFTELATGDIRTHHYAVVTDGRIAIGLHGGQFPEPALSFVKPDLAVHARALEAEGVEFSFQRLGSEDFHEVGFHSPDGHLVVLMEAPTFPLAQLSDKPEPVLGHSTEISLGSRNLARSVAFWHGVGFIPDIDEDTDEVTLFATGIQLGLRDDQRERVPVLRFEPPDIEVVTAFLENKQLPVRPVPEGVQVTAPEGTVLLLVD